jgi:hypothetical protein
MKNFIHDFEGKTFKLNIRVNQFDCHLGFEIFDELNIYLYVQGLPIYKKRLMELIENLRVPKQTNEVSTFNYLPAFNFGYQNKSYLLFNLQMIMSSGTLMGCLYDKDCTTANHFTITAIAGKELSEFLENCVNE